MKHQIHTTVHATTEDGCTYTDPTGIATAAANLSAYTQQARDGFPRFTLICDEETKVTNYRPTLERWIRDIRAGVKCRVFRNAGKGATIDFDDLETDSPEVVTATPSPAPLEGDHLYEKAQSACAEAGIGTQYDERAGFPIADVCGHGYEGAVRIDSRAKRSGYRGRPVGVIIPVGAADEIIRAKLVQFKTKLAKLQAKHQAHDAKLREEDLLREARANARKLEERRAIEAIRVAAGGSPDSLLPAALQLRHTNASDAVFFVQYGKCSKFPYANVEAGDWTVEQRADLVVSIDGSIVQAIAGHKTAQRVS